MLIPPWKRPETPVERQRRLDLAAEYEKRREMHDRMADQIANGQDIEGYDYET